MNSDSHVMNVKGPLKVLTYHYRRYILRNYICQNAIDAAEKGDFSEVDNVLKLLSKPYDDKVEVSPMATGDVTSECSNLEIHPYTVYIIICVLGVT